MILAENLSWDILEHAQNSLQKKIGYFLGGVVIIVGGHFLKQLAEYYRKEKYYGHDVKGLGWLLFGAILTFLLMSGGIAYWVEG